ncbi:MAG TPA: LLM class flavin-dependent oxidoreductase [Ktedonobacterales bacterium]|jgi:alkanesulfonate monooxygenase SsuD/methylene tetrahydromethanopterin reductase-like flavin-dependent oxidoreductase (luciferase family)
MAYQEGIPLGWIIDTAIPPEKIAPIAALAEELGYAEILVAEDYFCGGGFSVALAALNATKRIPVGLGIVSALSRHPAVLAMEIAAVSRLFPGRFRPGISLGLPMWVHQMGYNPAAPATVVRECLTSVRALLSGEELTATGQYFSSSAIKLAHPPREEVPLYLGVSGPKLLRVSGKYAEGTLLNLTATPAFVAWARQQVALGMKSAGRTNAHRFPVITLYSVGSDGAKAKEATRGFLSFVLAALGPTAITDLYGISEQLADMIARGGPGVVAREMPQAWIEDMTISGTPEECVAKMRAFLNAGADALLLFPLGPEDMARFTAAEVFPLLQA